MPDNCTFYVNGVAVTVPSGTILASAILNMGISGFRRSVGCELRAPFCGMGICFECRVTINGEQQRRSCQTTCDEGMDVHTGD